MKIFQLPSPTQQLHHTLIAERGVEVVVKRDDLIHPEISGNKWRKLKYNLQQAQAEKKSTLLTFGGAYSNHLLATAVAAKEFGLKSVGVVRGEELRELNSTLTACRNAGMRLHFVSRAAYRNKQEIQFIKELQEAFGDFYQIPEGGANQWGVKGCEEILAELDTAFDFVACAAGTGTTAAGILRSITDKKLLVFPALKGGDGLKEEVLKWQKKETRVHQLQFIANYHFGGYAKINSDLVRFANRFYRDFSIPLDLVYTAKLFYGVFDLLQKAYFPSGSKLLLIHSGGLQGNRGLCERYGLDLSY